MPTLMSINNYYYRRGGAENVFLEHNRLLSEGGWQIIPFAMQHPKNLPCEWDSYFVDEIEFGEQYSLWDNIKRAPKIIYSIEARNKLAHLIDRTKPDICHIHNIYHHISPSILGAIHDKGIPIVLTVHDLKLACPAYKMFTHDGVCERCKNGKIYNVVLHRCIKQSRLLSGLVMIETALHRLLGSYTHNVRYFIIPSRFVLEKLVEWGWNRDHLVHIPNFIDLKDFTANYNVGKYFLYIGRLVSEKGVATLIRAASLARVPLVIAGTGPESATFHKLAVDLGGDVTFTGHVLGDALHNLVREARAVVLPSELYENSPLSLMEAYSLGKSVIGSRIGGIPELIREENTGITFTPGSVDGLAEALRRFANMNDLRLKRMGQEGRSWMAAEYSAEHYRERILTLYRELRHELK